MVSLDDVLLEIKKIGYRSSRRSWSSVSHVRQRLLLALIAHCIRLALGARGLAWHWQLRSFRKRRFYAERVAGTYKTHVTPKETPKESKLWRMTWWKGLFVGSKTDHCSCAEAAAKGSQAAVQQLIFYWRCYCQIKQSRLGISVPVHRKSTIFPNFKVKPILT